MASLRGGGWNFTMPGAAEPFKSFVGGLTIMSLHNRLTRGPEVVWKVVVSCPDLIELASCIQACPLSKGGI